ncbi:MAG TPA: histidine kinase [Pyrinomonadaceae bacterium]
MLFVPQVYFYNSSSQTPLPLGLVLLKLALGVYSWALLTPPILLVSRRWIVERQRLLTNLFIHFCFSLLFAAAQTLLYHAALTLLTPGGFGASAKELPRLDGPLSFIFNGIVAYMSILAVHQAVLHYRQASERAFRLQQAQLRLLQTQLQPHFLFNSLNLIASLIYSDQAEAERTVLNLSDMLRVNLYEMGQQETSLREEVEFVDRYVQIMRARFPGRLEVRTDIDPEAFDAAVPTMMLQPLVENSIRHGILPRSGGGVISIEARRERKSLLVTVSDDGCGVRPVEAGGGVGLANMRARLQYLYGSQQSFSLFSRPGGGTTVRATLPFRAARGNLRTPL